MERNPETTEVNSIAFQRPRFPRLIERDPLEILQYKLGRDLIIHKTEYLANKFEDYLYFTIKPYIRVNQEPWEILKWYVDSIFEIIEKYDLEDNLKEYLEYSKKSPPGYYYEELNSQLEINFIIDQQTCYLIGIDWIHKLPIHYWKYFYNIYRDIDHLGAITIWDHFNDYDVFSFIEDMYDGETEEVLKINASVKKTQGRQIHWDDCHRPKKLPTPKNDFEKTLNDVLTYCYDQISLINGYHLTNNQSEEDYNDGALDIAYMFSIVDNGNEWNPYVEKEYYEIHIEQSANNTGVAPWRLSSPTDGQFEIKDFRIEIYEAYNALFTRLLTFEEQIYRDYV